MINHYKFEEKEFLGYSDHEIEWPDFIKIELITEDVNPFEDKYCTLSIYNTDNILKFLRKTPDKILEKEGLISWDSLCATYYLVKQKKCQKSKRVRDLAVEKYLEILSLINPKYECKTTEPSVQDSETT